MILWISLLFSATALADTDAIARNEIENLKVLIEQRFIAQERAVSAALTSAKEAVGKAEVASEKRFDSVNEFRNQQRDLINTFMPRSEMEQQYKSLSEKIAAIQARVDKTEGRDTGVSGLWGVLVAIIGMGFGLYGILHRKGAPRASDNHT